MAAPPVSGQDPDAGNLPEPGTTPFRRPVREAPVRGRGGLRIGCSETENVLAPHDLAFLV